MFKCLMYLFENYIHSEMNVMMDNKVLTEELTEAGFQKETVYKALAWIERLASMQDNQDYVPLGEHGLSSIRIFTEQEMMRLDLECRGFLHFLECINVLGPDTREMVIDRAMEIENKEFSVDDLKWVILMVLFNLPGQERAFTQLEGIMFDEGGGVVH
ncbi:DUF494 family protein [Psychrobium sp. 1_MG-2023]|uniref:DUF494 family protein n=1 Tax=Psychrobium sp. 1_MG-2023 TaxID=3062624 RepID=UPI000C327B8D|nr:DUF494 family protein [Psychrobium sp. 1_MG-2023]MDP2560394.1 DUF494 family protein [Psychrobium sp. 1_MG-2023]PKF57937.1 hypothetical protein CW748_05295 [Alteromonadales bacterium alter-6D02]